MKRVSRKAHLKKVMMRQHILIGSLILLGVVFVITKAGFISQDFLNTPQSTGDIVNEIYSGNTYTKYMSGRSTDTPQCNSGNMSVEFLSGGANKFPNIITGNNTLYVLSSGTYVNTTNGEPIILSGTCIALIGSGDVFVGNTFDLSKATYSVIDNLRSVSSNLTCPEYTASTTPQCSLTTYTTVNYLLTGDITAEQSGTVDSTVFTVSLKNPNDKNNIDLMLIDSYNVLNHFNKIITHDNTAPTITATSYEGTNVIENGIYNTGITANINETNLSGASNYGTAISGTVYTADQQGLYNIKARDKAGNETLFHFEIDTTAPNTTSNYPASGQTQTGSTLTLTWTTAENTAKIKSQKVYLYAADATTLLTSQDILQNTFTFSSNQSNGRYVRQIVITDIAGNVYTGNMTPFKFVKVKNISAEPSKGNLYDGKYYINQNPIIVLSGNKSFTYNLYANGSWKNGGNCTDIGTACASTINEDNISGNVIITGNYTTSDENGAFTPMTFWIDRENPSILNFTPKGIKQKNTGIINYTRQGIDSGSQIARYDLFINDALAATGSSTFISYQKTGTEANKSYKAQLRATDRAGNIGRSTVETVIMDNTAPTISNVKEGVVYKTQQIPVITDENNEPVQITIIKNGVTISSGTQNTPYIVTIDKGEAKYTISTSDTAGNSTGVSFTIDTTAPTTTLNSPASGTNYTTTNSPTFSRTSTDANISGHQLYIQGLDWPYFSTGINIAGQAYTYSNLANGRYQWQVYSYDKAGNGSTTTWIPFTVNVPLKQDTTTSIISGTTNFNSITYTTGSSITLRVDFNKETNLNITGDIIGDSGYPILNKSITADAQNITIPLSAGDGTKDIFVTASATNSLDNSTESTGSYFKVYKDTTGPSTPLLSQNQAYSGSFTVSRTAASDSGAGIYGYYYEITGSNTIAAKTINNYRTVSNMEFGLTGTDNLRVYAIDNLGNTGARSSYALFTFSGTPDTSADSFSFTKRTDAIRGRTYNSNSITVAGLSSNTTVKATLDEGRMYVNSVDRGLSYMVSNGDNIYIELDASDEYDDVTSSTLTIGDQAATYKIITEEKSNSSDDDDDYSGLTSSEEDELDAIAETVNAGDSVLINNFKTTLKKRIQTLKDDDADQIDIDKAEYLYDQIDGTADTTDISDTIYTAPNGKNYIITYESGKGYTSINFSKTGKYFPTLAEIKSHIDKNNPVKPSYTVDTKRASSNFKAPNGKVYTLFKTTDARYSSYNMVIPKFFATVNDLKNYIRSNNYR